MVKLVKIEGTEVKGLGSKYNTEDGAWRIIPIKGSVRHPGVGQKRQGFVEWHALEMKGDRVLVANSFEGIKAKLENCK